MTHLIGNVILVIVSYYKPNVCKYHLYYMLLFECLAYTLPFD